MGCRDTFGCLLALKAPGAVLLLPPQLLTFLFSFQVPWFGSIPIAVSNDISERSLESFIQEVRQPRGVTMGLSPSCDSVSPA